MEHRGFIAAFLAAALLTGVAMTVTAEPQGPQAPPARGMGRGPGGPGGFGLPLRELDLSDAQKTQIQQIRESHRAEFEQLAAQMRALEEKVRGEVISVLTPEQQEKLKTFDAQRGPRPRRQRQ